MEQQETNRMGTMPVRKLMVSISVPIVISMLVQAMYNIVDSIFVAKISKDALTAVSLVFPVQNLMIAVSVGTAVGINSLLSRRLGEKNFASANRVAVNGIFVTFLSWLVFAVTGMLTADAFFRVQSNISPELANMGREYMIIVTAGSLGLFMAITLERLLQATGRSLLSMTSQLVGAVTNIILDPILIFGLLGFPKMGVAGAALATIIGQFLGMFVSIYFNITKNKDIQISFRGFRPNPKTIKHIYQVGLPSIIMGSIGSVMVFGLNRILSDISDVGVAILGIYFKVQSFIFMPVFAVNNGMVSVLAYNYGARKKERIREALIFSAQLCFAIMVFGLILFWILPEQMMLLFNAEEDMLAAGALALRRISLCFPLAALGIVLINFFTALGQGVLSLIMSVVRQLVFLLPVAWLLARAGGLNAVWWAFPISDAFTMIMAYFFFLHAWKKYIVPLGAPGSPGQLEEEASEAAEDAAELQN